MIDSSCLRARPNRDQVIASKMDDLPDPFWPEMQARSKLEKSISTGSLYDKKPLMDSVIGIMFSSF